MLISKSVRFCAPQMLRKSMWHWSAIFAFCLYVMLCGIAFYTLVQPALNHESSIRLGADSDTYLSLADLVRTRSGADVAFVSLSGNLLGPIVIALLLKTGVMIALFNLCLFCIALYAAGRIEGVDRWMFAVLVMINAETLVSIVTLNKEILALFSATLFSKYIYSKRRSRLLLLIIFISAFLARWQQFAITFLYLLLRREGSFFSKRPKLALALIILLISVAYPIMASQFDLSGLTMQGETGGTMTTMNNMQTHFLYPVVVLPKILMNLSGQLITPHFFFDEYWTRDFDDLQNQFAIQLHTLATVILCFVVLIKGRFRLQQPLIFFCALYLVVTALTPFVQPRYQYPVYILFCLELSRSMKSLPVQSMTLASSASPWPRFRMLHLGLADATNKNS